MNESLITIAIPTYNNEKTIQNAVASCLNQNTEETYEVLIVNNASNDNTGSIIKQYETSEKVKIVTNDQTVSLFENHNVCLKNANGKYILFCHSDDTLEKHAIETLTKKINERNYPEKYVLWGHSMFRDFSHVIVKNAFNLNELIVGEMAPQLFFSGGLTPSGTCYSKDSFLFMGGFLKTTHRLAPSDMTTMLYLALAGFRFEMMDEMIFRRTYASTLSSGTQMDELLESLDDAFKSFMQVVDDGEMDRLFSRVYTISYLPMPLYYPLSKHEKYKRHILKLAVKKLLSRPLYIRDKGIRKLFTRLLTK